MANSKSTRITGRPHRRFYHWHLCRFEPLEPRQVLSSVALANLAAYQLTYPTLSAPLLTGGTAKPVGFTPAQMRQAYGFNNITFPGGVKADGTGMTIAIVDSGNDPTVVADLKAFDAQFGIPDPPSFKVVNQNGSTNLSTLPANDQFSSLETSLDVQWAHAIAPGANILLVEVNDPFALFNPFGSVDPTQMELGNLYARSVPGVVVVSNSWGGQEFNILEGATDSVFTTPSGHAGVTFVFSAGDSGGPASYPSASPNVLSVGGTILTTTANGTWTKEVVWNDPANGFAGGGGQSGLLELTNPISLDLQLVPVEPVPNYQAGLGLTSRGTPDVSMDSVNFPVYDSFAFGTTAPWVELVGTSGSAPMWAGLIAIADQGRARVGKSSLANVQSVIYKLPAADFHDITVGNNDVAGLGFGFTGNPATPGYDLASGRGTPIANLVIRDLVAFNGSTFISPITHPISSNSSGIWYFFGNSKTPQGFGNQGSSDAVTMSSSSVSATKADEPNSSADSTVINTNARFVQTQVNSPRINDHSLQFDSDARDDGSYLSHRFHRDYDADAVGSYTALDGFFAQI